MYIRWSKIILLAAIALFSTLVTFNNLTDYTSNFRFVSHVLSMDDTFPGNQGMWRAIRSPWVHHAGYIAIIATEFFVALLCWAGAVKLYRSRAGPEQFNREKKFAVCGLTAGMVLWFTGFMTIGGEWFLMWQSATWNGQEAAFRLVVIMGIALVYIATPEKMDEQ
jgi:predicted small integral membrane protein